MSALPDFSSISYKQLEKGILSDLRPNFGALLDALALNPPNEQTMSIRAELIAFHDFFKSTVLAIEEEVTELLGSLDEPNDGPALVSSAATIERGALSYVAAIDLMISEARAGENVSEVREVLLSIYDLLSELLLARISSFRAITEPPPSSIH